MSLVSGTKNLGKSVMEIETLYSKSFQKLLLLLLLLLLLIPRFFHKAQSAYNQIQKQL